jgi:hypothetical protein
MKKRYFSGLFVMLLALGFCLAGCDTGTGGGGLPENIKKLRFETGGDGGILLDVTYVFDYGYGGFDSCGFSVKVNGTPVAVSSAWTWKDSDMIAISLVDCDLVAGDEVLLSYSGDFFPGLSAFTDLRCSESKY